MPIGAAIGAAAIGAGGAIYAADQQSGAIGDATSAQSKASAAALAEQQRQYDTTRSDQMPWLTTGGSALSSLAKLYGLDTYSGGQVQPGGKPGDMSDFFTSPDYQFRFDQGIAGVDAGAAARGSLDSGATRKAEMGYASNLASGEFGNYVSRLMGLAGVGQGAAQSIGAFGQQTANNVSNIYQNQGDNLASSYLLQGRNDANMISQLSNYGSGLLMNAPWGSGAGANPMTNPNANYKIGW